MYAHNILCVTQHAKCANAMRYVHTFYAIKCMHLKMKCNEVS